MRIQNNFLNTDNFLSADKVWIEELSLFFKIFKNSLLNKDNLFFKIRINLINNKPVAMKDNYLLNLISNF